MLIINVCHCFQKNASDGGAGKTVKECQVRCKECVGGDEKKDESRGEDRLLLKMR